MYDTVTKMVFVCITNQSHWFFTLFSGFSGLSHSITCHVCQADKGTIYNEERVVNNHMMELIVVSDITLCSELSVLSLPQILGSF